VTLRMGREPFSTAPSHADRTDCWSTMKPLAQTVLFIICAIMLMGVLPNGDGHDSNDDQVGSAITVATARNTASARTRANTGLRVGTGHVLGSRSPVLFDAPAKSPSRAALRSSCVGRQSLCLLRC